MSPTNLIKQVALAEVLLLCKDLDANTRFFVEELGFEIEAIFPADNPKVTNVVGYGMRLRLEASNHDQPIHLRLLCKTEKGVTRGTGMNAPNGSRIRFDRFDPPVEVPPCRPALVINRASDAASWVQGRAGMFYRDLLPCRHGGRFIASHIKITEAGPVPDYVHYHKVRFQMIYCLSGWVKVVYEDQGPPFYLEAGDCVLQPPRIRHQVLESSDNLEVLEIGCPANHETLTDRFMQLPTGRVMPGRDFGGQVFHRYIYTETPYDRWTMSGFKAHDLGIAKATKGLVGVHRIRASGENRAGMSCHKCELMFLYVLDGTLQLILEEETVDLKRGDCCTIPKGIAFHLKGCEEVHFLEVRLPAT